MKEGSREYLYYLFRCINNKPVMKVKNNLEKIRKQVQNME